MRPGRFSTARILDSNSSRTRVTTNAENIETRTPMVRVTPKPRTAPAAKKKKRTAARRVVTLASRIALQAR